MSTTSGGQTTAYNKHTSDELSEVAQLNATTAHRTSIHPSERNAISKLPILRTGLR
ncbi:MAG: hypothetical protein QM751_15610 [Paludibacteraceae bacterium]